MRTPRAGRNDRPRDLAATPRGILEFKGDLYYAENCQYSYRATLNIADLVDLL